MKTSIKRSASSAGYSLIEVALAASILMVGVGAACMLSLTMMAQEEAHVRVTRAANVMENAVRLYHLGIDTSVPSSSSDATVFSLLPPDPMVKTFTASAQSSGSVSGIGNPQLVSFTMDVYTSSDSSTYSAGTWGGRPDTSVTGQKDSRVLGPVKAYRHSYRP